MSQLTQYIKQTHDALQSHAAKAINVGLTVYPQFLGDAIPKIGGNDLCRSL